MAKYRRKPIIFECEQFHPEKVPWPSGVEQKGSLNTEREWSIVTLEGRHIVTPGDWIVTGVKGEKWPVKPDVFEATYEKVDE